MATAYYAGGEFSPKAFVAQYGELPRQMAGLSLPSMIYVFNRKLSPVELFIHGGEIPEEIMDLLGPLVPPPEKFRVEGLKRTPHAIDIDGERLTLLRADTEQTGLHDLLVYLRMLRRGEIRTSTTSRRLTPASVRKLLNNLLDGDFFSHAEVPSPQAPSVPPASPPSPASRDWPAPSARSPNPATRCSKTMTWKRSYTPLRPGRMRGASTSSAASPPSRVRSPNTPAWRHPPSGTRR